MKKIVMFLVATMLFSSLYAADCEKSGVITDDYFCGSGSTTISSDCWSATYTVTICGDFESQAEATIAATLAANSKKKLLAAIVVLLNEEDPC